jgi:hypothetical protein
MTTHIAQAKAQADHIDTEGYAHPAYEKAALRGILHALLALHEQNETKPAPKRTTTPKEPK